MIDALRSLYIRRFGAEPASVTPLRPDGSNRRIYRLTGPDGSSVIGVHGPDREENTAFLSFSRTFRSLDFPVPEIHAVDEEAGIYLEEDLGDTTLFDLLMKGRGEGEFPEEAIELYRKVISLLPRLQIEGGRAIDFSVAYPCREFDRRSMMWDLNYFKYHFLKLAHIPFHEERLEEDFRRLCDLLLEADRTTFLYRDFQSRNIMARDGNPWLIDYQGGRLGALHYDIASLLYDAKAAIPDHLRESFLELYLDELERLMPVDRERFVELYRGFVLIRIMQAMGAYGYRGFFERKEHFLASVPYAVANIAGILSRGPMPVELPELRAVFERIIADERFASGDRMKTQPDAAAESASAAAAPEPAPRAGEDAAEASPLRVLVRSFSYRRGYPAEGSEHGGGFVFDCRAIHNPGRYDQYKILCGCDRPVIEFLEKEKGVEIFWTGVSLLIDNAVEAYLERGFAHLSVSFGCTGGQHRSVYFAERLSRHLRERFSGVSVELEHRERDRWVRTLP